MSDTRYIAAWVKRDGSAPGEFNPDDLVYGYATCTSLEVAQQKAITMGKRCNITTWARVTEETFNPDVGIPRAHEAAWDDTRVWHGDWEGNWEEERISW